ncbi:MAG: glutamate formimidoyltransferase [Bradymonadales bacterium]|nr:glutamate formimidoyltransferase [Bradymonadales bacterium]
MQLIECVPNFSQGRDHRIIDAIAAAASSVEGVRVLDVDPGADTNRTVLTFVGAPQAVLEAAFQVIQKATELIDMRRHKGAHPRHGAVDVCPFVPVSETTMDDCVKLAHRLGERVGKDLEIPGYYYEHAALCPERRNLAAVRKGEYEALPDKLIDPAWKPDFGPARWDDRVARTGVVTIGARQFLIAYNINLNTKDARYAKDLANQIRESGRNKREGNIVPAYFKGTIVRYRPKEGIMPCGLCEHVANSLETLDGHYQAQHQVELAQYLAQFDQQPDKLEGQPVKKPGLFTHCKATGWVIQDYGCAQVTMNLTDYHVTPPHLVLEVVREQAAKMGIVVTGSELVGLIPFDALLQAGKYYQRRYGGSTGLPWRDLLQIAVRSMKLDDLAPFDIDKKVIGLPEWPARCLAALPCRDFVDEVSRDSPAPGGGSVAALAGALGAALVSMVANLAINKKGYYDQSPPLDGISAVAQTIKDRLVRAVDTDTEAFNAVIAARRLPSRTPQEKADREKALQEGYQTASQVPLSTAKLCLEAVQLADQVAHLGNPASISDAGLAALMGCAGVEGAVYNVRINLPFLSDPAIRAELEQQLDQVVAEARRLRDQVDVLVLETIRDR